MRPMRAAVLVILSVLLLGLTACVKERPPLRGPGTVLILLDSQRDYLSPSGRMPVAQDQIEPLLKGANAMIAAMQQQALPIIYAYNEFSPFDVVGNFERNFAAMRFEPGSTLDKRINYLAGVYLSKSDWSAFDNPQFDEHLQLIGAGHLVIAGTNAEHSVLATAREAIRRRYQVTVISDAVASRDAQRRDSALQQAKQAGAEVISSDQFISGLGAEQKNQG